MDNPRQSSNDNSAVRVQRVFELGEQKLVFKVIVSQAAVSTNHGVYSFDLPPLTDDTNSTEYNQAIMKLDTIIIDPISFSIPGIPPNVENNANAVWTDRETLAAGASVPFGGVILSMNLPSRNCGRVVHNSGNPTLHNSNYYYKFQELIPAFWEFRGNYQGIYPGGLGAVGNQYAIKHQPNHEGVLCANPFGSKISYNFNIPADIEAPKNIYLCDRTNGTNPRDDITRIDMQFTITLLKNK